MARKLSSYYFSSTPRPGLSTGAIRVRCLASLQYPPALPYSTLSSPKRIYILMELIFLEFVSCATILEFFYISDAFLMILLTLFQLSEVVSSFRKLDSQFVAAKNDYCKDACWRQASPNNITCEWCLILSLISYIFGYCRSIVACFDELLSRCCVFYWNFVGEDMCELISHTKQ